MAYRSKRYTRDELNQEARRLGLSPRRYRNKDLLVEALNELVKADKSILPPFRLETCLGDPRRQGFTRGEADEYGTKVGLEAASYPNKRAVCEAIQNRLAPAASLVAAPSRTPVAVPAQARPAADPAKPPASPPLITLTEAPVRVRDSAPAASASSLAVSIQNIQNIQNIQSSQNDISKLPFPLRDDRPLVSDDWNRDGWNPFPLQLDLPECGYRRQALLGEGGYGSVYDVSREGRTFALKVTKSDISKTLINAQLIEAYVLAHARHPHVARAYDIFFSCGVSSLAPPSLYYLLQKADGGNLKDWLKTSRTTIEKLNMLQQIVSGVAFLHRHSVIHADLKPYNILVHQGKAQVADFSLAKRWTGTPHSELVQTYYWRAPEIELGEYGLPSDMWAVGMLMWDIFGDDIPLIGYRANRGVEILLPSIFYALGKPEDWPAAHLHDKYNLLMTGQGAPKPYARIKIPALKGDPLAPEIWELFNQCLTFDPTQRITAAEFLRSPLFAGLDNPTGHWIESGPTRMLNSPKFTKILYEWLEALRNRMRSPISTLALTFDLIERTLAIIKQPGNKDLQLLGVTCYSLAAAINEKGTTPTSYYVRMCAGAYTADQILAAQKQICQLLRFQLWPTNWPVVCTIQETQKLVIEHLTHVTLPTPLQDLYTARDYAELCYRA